MFGSNLARRGMVDGLAVRVSTPAAVSSDTFIDGACAQSARKTLVFGSGLLLGDLASGFRPSQKERHSAYRLTLIGLRVRSHLLGKDRNFETHADDISNVVEWNAQVRIR
jgi:hypothetical protein